MQLDRPGSLRGGGRAVALEPRAPTERRAALRFLAVAWHHRPLIARLVRREISARYRSSLLGFAWALLHPLLLLAVYTFVFSVVFKARWGFASEGHSGFAFMLFSGLLVYNLVAASANAATQLVVQNAVLVKEMLFPTEVLAWVQVGVRLFDLLIGLALLLLCLAVTGTGSPATWLWLPAVALPVVLGTLGIVWGLSVLGAFFRDLSPIVQVATMALLFLSPIFYSVSQVPEQFRLATAANPLSPVLEMWRGALFRGEAPEFGSLVVLMGLSWMVAAAGFAWYLRAKPHLADVV